MITDKEKQEIVNLAIEKTLLMVPEVVGNMMVNHITMAKINSEFYEKHPEFRNKKDIVVSVVEMIEGRNPTADYEKILIEAVPEIRKRMTVTDSLNLKTVPSNPDRRLKLEDLKLANSNGEL